MVRMVKLLVVATITLGSAVACSSIEQENSVPSDAPLSKTQVNSENQHSVPLLMESAIASDVVLDVEDVTVSYNDESEKPASSDQAESGNQILVSELGFIKVGFDESVAEIDPPGVNPWCVSPGEGYPPPMPEGLLQSQPSPRYLPEGISFDKEVHDPSGRHVGNVYLGRAGARIHTSFGVCLSTYVEPGFWELMRVGDHWGILIDGAWTSPGIPASSRLSWAPGFALTLYFETDQGYGEVRTFQPERTGVDKNELLKIAESMVDD